MFHRFILFRTVPLLCLFNGFSRHNSLPLVLAAGLSLIGADSDTESSGSLSSSDEETGLASSGNPVMIIQTEEGSDPDPCPICLEKYRQNELVTRMACNHEAHQHCLLPWLTRELTDLESLTLTTPGSTSTNTCPVCRRIVSENEDGKTYGENYRVTNPNNPTLWVRIDGSTTLRLS